MKVIQYTIAIIFLAVILPKTGSAQITSDSINAKFNIYDRLSQSSNNGSEIIIDQNPQVGKLLKQHFERGKSGKNMRGWRVRIYRDTSRDGGERSASIVGAIKNNYPGIPTYRTYQAPYWYVSIGDFRTRDEAEKIKRDLQNTYPGASLIETHINFPPLQYE